MRVVITVESRFLRTPDGKVWTHEGPAYRFFVRYLAAFENVRVVARVQDVAAPPQCAHRVDGMAVAVWALPYYQGPLQYLFRWVSLNRLIRSGADANDAVVLRVPSAIGSLMAAWREGRGLTYALEVMGDPYDVFAPGVIRHPLRPFLRHRFTSRLRQLCRGALGVAYVTSDYLQARYPPGPSALTANYSSVDLPSEAYVDRPRTIIQSPTLLKLLSVGSLDQMYKGIDTAIRAVGLLVADGVAVQLIHVGDGIFRTHLEQLAAGLGVEKEVNFVGMLPAGTAVRQQLDAADVFLMPSRTEGLPKALIEAMARGLPCVGSTVGGIPELLTSDQLTCPDDPVQLASIVRQLSSNPGQMAILSAINLAKAHEFSAQVLTARRAYYYTAVREATQHRTRNTRLSPPRAAGY